MPSDSVRPALATRVGLGYDVHRLELGYPLWLCGVQVDSPVGAVGHSDADAPLHAVCDALLGALALGDIGQHFPDTDAQYKGAASRMFVERAVQLALERSYQVGNVDVVIALQAPKIAPYIQQMRASLAEMLGLTLDDVSVKATTTERLGFVGRQEGVMAQAAVTMFKVR